MSTFVFTCPACATELDVDDADRGEMAECPNCQAEIKIPLVKTPQVKMPHVKVPLVAEPPVPKKKLLVSQRTAAALAGTGARTRRESKSGVLLGFFVGLVVGVGVGVYFPVQEVFRQCADTILHIRPVRSPEKTNPAVTGATNAPTATIPSNEAPKEVASPTNTPPPVTEPK